MRNLKIDGLSGLERLILFSILTLIIFLFEMAKSESKTQDAKSLQAEQTKGGE